MRLVTRVLANCFCGRSAFVGISCLASAGVEWSLQALGGGVRPKRIGVDERGKAGALGMKRPVVPLHRGWRAENARKGRPEGARFHSGRAHGGLPLAQQLIIRRQGEAGGKGWEVENGAQETMG